MFSRRFSPLAVAAVALAAAATLASCAGTAQYDSAARADGAARATISRAAFMRGFDGWPAAVVEIRTKSGRQRFKVLVADTPERQERGLMFVTQLPFGVGMVFPQTPPQVVRMWMKNTLISLDMVFLGADHRVLYVRENAPVESLDIISTDQPAAAVLEIAAGESARRGIHVGDRFVGTGSAALK